MAGHVFLFLIIFKLLSIFNICIRISRIRSYGAYSHYSKNYAIIIID